MGTKKAKKTQPGLKGWEKEKMAGVSRALTWQDVKEWMEKHEPYMLQTVLKTATTLLVTHCNKSEQSAGEVVKNDKEDDLEEKKGRYMDSEEIEAGARKWEETENGGKKTESNKWALQDVNEILLEEYRTQERAIFGGDKPFHKLVSDSLKEGKVREDILVAQRMLYRHRKNFFKEKIGSWEAGNWFTYGGDDTHDFEVIPFQITKNYEEVMRHAASNRKINIFFKNDSSSEDFERWLEDDF